ncbi:hypothetical protein V499_04345 [Pseudogymnoascus sp. VKM F-103]|nr:hypothetical protein V499_04345 [Pseudogymnoascus sp. VKM F-103]
MTTPGRTHVPWQTQTAQISELISYIGFLEAKVSYLQRHHEHCDTGVDGPPLADANLPYLPPDIVVVNDESRIVQATQSSPALSLTTTQPPKNIFGGNPRWKQIINQLTTGWDKASSWEDKRVVIGLDSVERNKYALTAILGLKKDLFPARDESPPSTSRDSFYATDALIMSARKYAIDSKASQTSEGLVVQVHIFRELVFASLCVVMEHQGLPIDTIDSLMRICISSSGSANLYRLRRGALWINRVISGTMMKKMGWGRGSTEFFFLSGRPVSQYGLLWEACTHSFPYLSKQLAHISCNVNVPIDDPSWIPFSIPVIIKQLLGDVLTIEQICTALDYSIDAV